MATGALPGPNELTGRSSYGGISGGPAAMPAGVSTGHMKALEG